MQCDPRPGSALHPPGSITGRRLQPRRSYPPGPYEAMALRRITCLSNPRLGLTMLLITIVIVPCGGEGGPGTNDVASHQL
jgi:hypothetical protein